MGGRYREQTSSRTLTVCSDGIFKSSLSLISSWPPLLTTCQCSQYPSSSSSTTGGSHGTGTCRASGGRHPRSASREAAGEPVVGCPPRFPDDLQNAPDGGRDRPVAGRGHRSEHDDLHLDPGRSF